MQHADDIPPRRHIFWRVVVPVVVLVLLGVGGGIVWQMVRHEPPAAADPARTVTKP
jgi:hypothetical protein